MVLLIAIAFSFNATAVFAQAPTTSMVELSAVETNIDLGPHLLWLEDAEGRITAEQIFQGDFETSFQPNTRKDFHGLNKSSRYWLRYQIRPGDAYLARQDDVIMQLPLSNTLTWRMSVYAKVNDRLAYEKHTGFMRPYNSRDIDTHYYSFRLPVQRNAITEVLIAVDNSETIVPVILPLKLYNETQFLKSTHEFELMSAVFYAIVFALFVYNVFLFVALKDRKVYGHYLIFILGVAMVEGFNDGYVTALLFADNAWRNHLFNTSAGILVPLAYIAFVFQALDARQHFPRLTRYYYFIITAGYASVAAVMLTDSAAFAVTLAQSYTSLVLSLVLVVVAYASYRRLPGAAYILAAESLMLTGATGYMLMYNGVLEVNSLYRWGLHWGLVGEALVLSLALASRTRAAQRAAIVNLERFESLYNESPVALFSYSFKDKHLKSNIALRKLLDYTHNEFARDPLSMVDPEDIDALVKLFETQRYVADYEMKLPLTQGDLWVALSVRFHYDDKQQPDLFEGSLMDISERKLKEAAERERIMALSAQQEAQEANQAKREFLSKISHELRTPMVGIIGMADVLKDRLREPSDQMFTRTILNSATGLLNILNDLLDFSKIEAGKMELENLPTHLEEVALEALSLFQVEAEQKGIELILDVDPTMNVLRQGDPVRIKQIMTNFLSNAVKYTEQGVVSLVIEQDAEDDNKVQITVNDDGVGIDDGLQAHIFDSFGQATTETARLYGGTGLGLSICKELAELMSGSIGVMSAEGKGSSFWVNVSLPQVIETLPSDAEAIQAESRRVAVCHRNTQLALQLSRLLEHAGHSVRLIDPKVLVSAEPSAEHAGMIEALSGSSDVILLETPLAQNLLEHESWHTREQRPRLVLLARNFGENHAGLAEADAVLAVPFANAQLRDTVLGRSAQAITLEGGFGQGVHVADAVPGNGAGNGSGTGQNGSLDILVADDNSVNQLVIRTMIEKGNHRCTVVENGQEAFDSYTNHRRDGKNYDLILMDFQMPELDGLQATQKIREWESCEGFSRSVIYGFTSEIEKSKLQQGLHAGMSGYLQKPVQQHQLNKLLEHIT